MKRGAVSVLLALSLAANVWLVLGSKRGRIDAVSPAAAADSGSADGSKSDGTAQHKEAVPAAPGTCSKYQAEVARLQTEVDKYLPWEQRFERGSPSEVTQKKVAPELKRIIEPTGASFNVECRGEICKIDIVRKKGQDFTEALQHDQKLRGIVLGYQFTAPEPTSDPVSGEALWRESVTVKMPSPSDQPQPPNGMLLLEGVIDRFEKSGAVKRCASDSPNDNGDLDLRLDVEPSGRIGVLAGGELHLKQSGRCFLAALDQIVRDTTTQPVISATLFHTIELPLAP